MKASKVLISVFLSVMTISALCAVNIQPVEPQGSKIIYINSDGSISTSDNSTVPIQRAGNLYTFNGSISDYSVVIRRNNIIVDGADFGLQGNADVGIGLSNRINVTVRNLNIVGGFKFGIYLLNSLNNLIVENDITNSNCGIQLEASNNNIISANNVTNCANGIVIITSSNNELRTNSLNNVYNFGVYGSDLAHFFNDIDNSNTVSGMFVYYLANQSDVVINSFTFPDLGFLALVNCINMTAQNLELTGNGQGVLLAFTTNSSIKSNTITKNLNGIMLQSSSNIMIFGNNITNNNNGIQLGGSSGSNRLNANNIKNNANGILLSESSQNTINENNITNNYQIGIGFSKSSSNMIYNNYFISNTKQVHDAHMEDTTIPYSVNNWNFDYPEGGNYWSNYTGVDVKSGANQNQPGSDGIGDTPYVIYENNQDNYPLLPYGSPPVIYVVSPENKTYTANDVSLIFSLSEPTKWIGYRLDGQAKVTITGNTTLTGLSEGSHSLTVYVNDTTGNTGASETIYFTIAKQSEPFPITWIVPAIALVAIGVATFLVYSRKHKGKLDKSKEKRITN